MKILNVFKKNNVPSAAELAKKRISNVVISNTEIPSENLEPIKEALIKALSEYFEFDHKDLKLRAKYTGQDKTNITLLLNLKSAKEIYELESIGNSLDNKIKQIKNSVNLKKIIDNKNK